MELIVKLWLCICCNDYTALVAATYQWHPSVALADSWHMEIPS